MKTKRRQARAMSLARLSLPLASLWLTPMHVQADPVPDGGPMTSGYGYDANGNLTTLKLPKGVGVPTARQQQHTYDSLGRRTTTTLPAPQTGASSPTLGFGYDGLDRLKTVTTPLTNTTQLSTSYTTSGLGNTSLQVSPDSGTTNAEYYEDGLLKTRTDSRGRVFKYAYDDLGRLTKITYNSGLASQFEYDGGLNPPNANSVGRLSKLTDETGTTIYTHDGLGRVITKTQLVTTATPRTFVLKQGWGDTGTEAGKLKSQTYPSFAKLNYAYDAVGRLQGITLNPVRNDGTNTNGSQTITLMGGIGYSPLNAVQGWTWGSGVNYARSFDEHGRLKTYPLGHPGGTGKAAGLTRTVTYDDAGRITGFTHSNTAFDQTYAHDDLDRLKQHQLQTSAYGFDYDLNGNRKSQTVGGTLYTNTLDATSNRLLKERQPGGTTSFTYDTAGDLKGDGTNTYTHGARGRLSSIALPAGTVNYLYNGLEQRLAKTSPDTSNTSPVPGGARYYVHDEAGHLVGEYDESGAPLYEVVYLGDTPVAVITQNRTLTNGVLNVQTKVSYVYADHLDTPRVIARSSDHFIQWRWDQAEAFGATPPSENPNALGPFVFNLRFPGQFYDKESKLVYNHHRYYDASTGRYVETDPIGLAGGSNTYSYVANRPWQLVDPFGLRWLVDPANRDPGSVEDASTIYCEGGASKLKLINQEGECPEIQECRRVHENVHASDAHAQDPEICVGSTNPVIIVNDEDKERLKSEEDAFERQKACLEEKLKTKCEPKCKSQILSKIRVVDYFLNKVRAGAYP
jgi:RHS repeat-associated protein